VAKRRTKPYHGSITKRGATWRVRLCVGGKYYSFTCGGTKADAQNFATSKHAELSADVNRALVGLPGRIRFSQLVREYSEFELPTRSEGTRKSYRTSFAAFEAFFGDRLGDPLVRDIRRHHVATFIEWRRTWRSGSDGEVSGHTVARDRRVLHRLFNYAVMKDHLEANPAAMVRAPKADPRTPPILTDAQLDALLDAAQPSPMLTAYITLLADTGVRAYSEALELTWDDIDFAGGFVHVRSGGGRRTKSGKSRSVPMTPRLRETLKDHAARYRFRSPFLFFHETTRRSAKEGERIRSIRGSFEAAARAAKLPAGFRAHDLRHRRVTTWLSEGKSVVLVQAAMGHSAIQTTLGYMHLVPEHLLSLVDVAAPIARMASGE
jgi:integrase